jgi:hypothetical protein
VNAAKGRMSCPGFAAGPGPAPSPFASKDLDIPHRYTVRTPSARMLMSFSPSGFEGFIRETSEPATRSKPSRSSVSDFDLIMAAAERYRAEVLG